MSRARKLVPPMLIAGLLSVAAIVSPASAAAACDLYASPAGSDSASGQLSAPLATVAALDAALAPGQTGCLESGTYGSISSVHRLTASGSALGQITITVAPGQSAKIVGLVELEGSYTTLSGLKIDGSNDLYNTERGGTNCPYPVSNGLEIDGHDDVFENNDFYQSIPSLRGNGIGIGWNGQADNTIIRYNRIHDLGQCMAFDQMIYVAHGNNVQIYDNWLWNDPHGWGIQIYPAASNAHVYDNVIDHAGSGIVIGGSAEVAGNKIDHNIILNSTGLPTAGLAQGVGISTCCGLGAGNTFANNDVYNNPGGVANATGIALTNNATTNPGFANPADHDYRSTTFTGWNLWDGGLGSLGSGPVAVTASAGHHHHHRAHTRTGTRRSRTTSRRRARSRRRHERIARRRHGAGQRA